MLASAGCGRSKVESTASISAGISWDSLLAEASDFSALARRISPAIKAKMFSSAADSSKVMLAHLAPEIIGDMDYGFFAGVTTNKDGFNATLAEFDGPGVVTWVWSANPVGTLKLYVDKADQPALSMPFIKFLEGGFLPVREPFGTITSLGHNLHFPIVHAKSCKLVLNVPRLNDLAAVILSSGLAIAAAGCDSPHRSTLQLSNANLARSRAIGTKAVRHLESTEPRIDLMTPES